MLKVKLDVSSDIVEDLIKELSELGVIISDDATLVLTDKTISSNIICKKDNRIYQVPVVDIVYFESQDHDLIIRTIDNTYTVRQTISYYEKILPQQFIRVHRSFIVNKDKIDHITPLLGMQFNLKMINNEKIRVSRNYYYQFKEKIGF